MDLFFLFDASASANGQLSTMLNQAKEIIKKFATVNEDDCHVGSALFLGPTLRMMCAQSGGNATADVFWRYGPYTYVEEEYSLLEVANFIR